MRIKLSPSSVCDKSTWSGLGDKTPWWECASSNQLSYWPPPSGTHNAPWIYSWKVILCVIAAASHLHSLVSRGANQLIYWLLPSGSHNPPWIYSCKVNLCIIAAPSHLLSLVSRGTVTASRVPAPSKYSEFPKSTIPQPGPRYPPRTRRQYSVGMLRLSNLSSIPSGLGSSDCNWQWGSETCMQYDVPVNLWKVYLSQEANLRSK